MTIKFNIPFQKFILLIAVISLLPSACRMQNQPNLWGESQIKVNTLPPIFATETPFVTATLPTPPALTSTPTLTFTPEPVFTPSITPSPAEPSPADLIQRVIILSFDGMRPDAIAQAPMRNLFSMMQKGAYTLAARTISYSATLPAHASMLSAMCQSKHGVDWNSTKYYLGYSQGTDVFDLAHAAGLRTVMIVNKEKLRQLAEPETTDVFELVYGVETTIMQTAIDQLDTGFHLMFVHFGSPDDRGHRYGWMSPAQLKALQNGDVAIGNLLTALDEHGMKESTLIIVNSDHGGYGTEHPGIRLQDLQIPWVAYGAGVQPGSLQNPVSVMDTAATAAYALELPIQPEWDGIPVYEAFGLPATVTHPDDFNICK